MDTQSVGTSVLIRNRLLAILCQQVRVIAIDEQRITSLALLDLSIAFDTVDHCTPLSVLEKRFGICDTTVEWFRSYLSDMPFT